MSKAKHTPGPWRIHGCEAGQPICAIGDRVICDQDKDEVAVVRYNAADCEANARLIAAAPDLLAALEQVARASEDCGDMNDIDWNGLRAAIAKARSSYVCVLCGQRIDDGKPCGCGARS
jgi:hypothetical protein